MASDADPSDSELLDAWRGGDARAGDRLVQRHFRSVFRFFRRKLDRGAEDLAQRTFLTCVETRDNVREGSSFRAYVLGIARNHLLHELRDRARPESPRRDPEGTSPLSPSGAVAWQEEQRVLLTALRRLPLDLQITLELHYWEQMTTAEVASVLDIAAGTVKWRLARARKLLEQQIAAVAGSESVQRSVTQSLDAWARSLRKLLDRPAQG
jgi:RNA polymerase sigma-70 factor (ECF subfamily)